jgi:MYXO-CTERM domain-containing protein
MHWLRTGLATLTLVVLAGACASVNDGSTSTQGAEEVGSVSQSITAACTSQTMGLPCDPDGPAGPKLECEGVCTIAATGYIACLTVTANAMNGVVCGTTNGVGNNACKRYCSGKTCLAANAPAGAGCRPTSANGACDGACDGSGACAPLAAPCDYGRRDQLCVVDTCNLANAAQCVTKNLPRNTICSDTDACSIGKCNAGTCETGSAVGCNDGNDCTDDACDPVDGGCVGTIDDSNSCFDGNKCTTGEHCLGGKCIAGVTPVDCNDNNACTSDTCDPNTGCAHIQKSCSDGDACTADDCDPQTGGCFSTPISCDDNDACTVDDCDAATGCTHTQKDCDDGDACTMDGCSAGACTHGTLDCNDSDACTSDACLPATGCSHTPIGGCGTGGTGSGGTSSAGGDGSQSDAGAPPVGAAGAPPTGDAGAASTGDAGSPATGEAGAPVNPSGGNAGTASGGTDTGGVSGGTATGGTSASSGAASGGVSTGGDIASSGTSTGNDAGTSADARSVESRGCGCRVAGQPRSGSLAGLLGVLGLVALSRRRRAVRA